MNTKIVENVQPIQTWGRCLAVVTGASTGIGAGICKGLSTEFPPSSIIVGIARSKEGLRRTENEIKLSNKGVTFLPYSLDLEIATEEDYLLMIKTIFEKMKEKQFDRYIIVHNAASMGALNYLKDITDTKEINKYFSLNISSIISLNGCLLKHMRNLSDSAIIHLVNISSLAAIQPIKSWALYCIGKAARDMLMNVLAIEDRSLNILNYGPGIIETNMQVTARASTSDPEVRELFNNINTEKKCIKMEDSIGKLIRIMKEGNYTSGSHIDYYTEI